MVKHIVMWTLKDEVDGLSKQEIAKLLKREIEKMADTVPQVRHIEAGINFNHGPVAYDLCLYSEFESGDDLAIYQDNEDHKKVKSLIVKYAENGVVTDYEI
ncbi:MAG: Dabb family protein [Spirochaetota bacterium]